MIAKDGGFGVSSTSSASFNLVDEPWIMVRYLDGNTGEVSLLQLLDQMQNIAQIAGELPTQDFAVFRTILAIFYRALDIETKADWFECYHDPETVCSDVREYLAAMHDRFDLRHPEYPFYQVPGKGTVCEPGVSLRKLIADYHNKKQGNEVYPFFVNRALNGSTKITWAEAARWLIYVQQFDVGGLHSNLFVDGKKIGGYVNRGKSGWLGQIGGMWINRENLYESIFFNLIPTDYFPSSDQGVEDFPSWETYEVFWKDSKGNIIDTDRLLKQDRIPQGIISLLTWQARMVFLDGDDSGVSGVAIGHKPYLISGENRFLEPMTTWAISQKDTKISKTAIYRPKRYNPAIQVWRGLSAILPQISMSNKVNINGVEYRQFRSALIIEWIHELVSEWKEVSPLIDLRTVGVIFTDSKSSTIETILNDGVELPKVLLEPERAHLQLFVRDSVKLVDNVAKAVFVLASQTSQAAGQSTEEAKAPAEDYKRKFYSNVDRDFRQWLKELRDPSDQEKLARYLRRAANDMEQEITESLPTDILFAASRAINRYRRVVNESLKNSLLIDLHNNQKGSAAKEKDGRDGK
ncbi:type I-E CRISPR-associated protein Cse1/CasA [Arcanobacterium hippocoleae]|uniref:CRISPR system Cascade subunit CasA n=1 Tax=Arcanobacterium hippocoleae TaxID=149017 RepID=A0ABU1T248_9ACTO|nr:type I-E CRISPR-associated protein Cse1/CasA [Arcanobacterium hippocoleae]MDR6939335.1 CRISPR system Cascade subunit CasA [Arcanobacterium hippocoleae]